METAIIEIETTGPLLVLAKKKHRTIGAIETAILDKRDELYDESWILGAMLCELKEIVGHGKWLLWLEGNFKELGKTESMRERNSQRSMKFYRENPAKSLSNPRNSSDLERQIIGARPKEFADESKRKLMWNYIPQKHRPELEGNRKLKAGAHYLSFVNHFAKFDRQVRVGLIPMPPVELFRTECEATLRRIIEIGGREWVESLLRSG